MKATRAASPQRSLIAPDSGRRRDRDKKPPDLRPTTRDRLRVDPSPETQQKQPRTEASAAKKIHPADPLPTNPTQIAPASPRRFIGPASPIRRKLDPDFSF